MKIQAVLFDLDGTITQPWFDFDRIRADIGIPSGSILEAIEQMPPARQRQARAILHQWEARGAEASRLNHGVSEFLQWLSDSGRKTALVTRNRRCNALRVCQLHHLTFDAVVTREDGPVKPDPFPIQHACRQLAVLPSNALMVGDYIDDMTSGRAAHAHTVLITTGSRHHDFHHAADFIVDQISQICQLIIDLESGRQPR